MNIKNNLHRYGKIFIASLHWKNLLVIGLWNLFVQLLIVFWFLFGNHTNLTFWNIQLSLWVASILINLVAILIIKAGLFQSILRPLKNVKDHQIHKSEQKHGKVDKNETFHRIDYFEYRMIVKEKKIFIFVINIVIALILTIISIPFNV